MLLEIYAALAKINLGTVVWLGQEVTSGRPHSTGSLYWFEVCRVLVVASPIVHGALAPVTR